MTSTVVLDSEDRDRLVMAIESSLRVRNSPSFFLWAQGALQALIPHDIMICAAGGGAWRGLQVRHFSSSRYFEQRHFEASCFGSDSLLATLMRDWESTGQPQFLLPGPNEGALSERLNALELRNLVAHGVRGVEPHSGGLVCFGRTTLDASPRTARILELLVPCVHTTYCRVVYEDMINVRSASRFAPAPITARETEILHLIKDGKSTGDIASDLGLSPFTVRNHVKNIFRKLNANSRGHAVAQAISRGILSYRT